MSIFTFYLYYMGFSRTRKIFPFFGFTFELLHRLHKTVIFNKLQVAPCKCLVKYTKLKLFSKNVVFLKKCGIIHMKFTDAKGCDSDFTA